MFGLHWNKNRNIGPPYILVKTAKIWSDFQVSKTAWHMSNLQLNHNDKHWSILHSPQIIGLTYTWVKKLDTGPIYTLVNAVNIGQLYTWLKKISIGSIYASVKKISIGLIYK